MQNYLNVVTKMCKEEGCFTFLEVENLLKPLLGKKRLEAFMYESGYLNDYGVLKASFMDDKRFRVISFYEGQQDYISPGIVFFITKEGFKAISIRAFTYYHSKRVPQVLETFRKKISSQV
jgi:hypothetical protein